MQLTFFGGTGTVTGSKFLLTRDSTRVLIDCGLFQGYKQLRLRNWEPLPAVLRAVDAVVLTHAHLDHSGYLPVLAREGFSGPVYATPATCALAEILLLDSARLQEEQAEHANRHGYSRHSPARPLYTELDAKRALRLFRPVAVHHRTQVAPGIELLLRSAGHILGAATVQLTVDGQTLVSSGDLGRPHDPVMRAPELIGAADALLVESTYGDRSHPAQAPERYLADVINQTLLRHGITLVPSFAIGRAQLLMYYLYTLKRDGLIPDIPVYLNSPMAMDATALYQQFKGEHRLTALECAQMCKGTHIIRTVDESRRLDQLHEPAVIIAASGMATGGGGCCTTSRRWRPIRTTASCSLAFRRAVPGVPILWPGRAACACMAKTCRFGRRCLPWTTSRRMRMRTKSWSGYAVSPGHRGKPTSFMANRMLRTPCADG